MTHDRAVRGDIMLHARMAPRGEVVRIARSALFAAIALTAGCAESAVVALGGAATELSITITPDPAGEPAANAGRLDMEVGESASLSATALNALGQPVGDAPISWGSSDVGVATVASDGTVTAVGPGSAEVFATSNDIFATLPVAVTEPPAPPGG